MLSNEPRDKEQHSQLRQAGVVTTFKTAAIKWIFEIFAENCSDDIHPNSIFSTRSLVFKKTFECRGRLNT